MELPGSPMSPGERRMEPEIWRMVVNTEVSLHLEAPQYFYRPETRYNETIWLDAEQK